MTGAAAGIAGCRLCAERFAQTASGHEPRPVVWFRPGARLLIAGQAPGIRVHQSGIPFDDPSGVRLRGWLGLDLAEFYDQSRVAMMPMAFCFPGHDAHRADLPPPPLCAATWRQAALTELGPVRLTLLVGGAALNWHLGPGSVTDLVAGWRQHLPAVCPLPHPSWRTIGWQARNPWFAAELLPHLRALVRKVMDEP